jgi:hypothetical protein
MGYQSGFHAPGGGADFLGFRKTRAGTTEIIYDDGVSRRMVWQVSGAQADEASLSDALSHAVMALRVVPAMLSEMSRRSILLERIIR